MATRYPLIIDTTDDNKIKELPDGDNLNLSGNNIVNVVDITASGTVTVGGLSVDTANFSIAGQTLDSVAFTGSYQDLDGLPILFSGNYSDLQGKPILKNTTLDLDDVSNIFPLDNQILVYDANLGYYQPQPLPTFANTLISDLQNVSFSSLTPNDVLKYNGNFWTNSKVDFSEITGTENVLIAGGDFVGSVFANDGTTKLVDGVAGKVTGAVETDSFVSNDPSIRLGPGVEVSVYGIGIGSNSKIEGYGVGVGVNSQADSYGTTIGAFAGTKHVENNTSYTVALGAFAQQNANPGDTTGVGAIAIGVLAGDSNQGANSVAIGRYAGRNNQAQKSIVINATDSDLENSTENSLVIKPIREAQGLTVLHYNKDTGEVTHSDLLIGDVKGSVFGDDSTPILDGVNNKLFADVDTYRVEANFVGTGSIYNRPADSTIFSISAQPGTLSMSIRGADETGVTQGTPLTISPGNNTDNTAQGGELLIIGGSGNPGGEVEIYGGNARNGGTGGATYLAGGANVDGSGNGGNLYLRGGRDIVNNLSHGDIYIGDLNTKQIYINGTVDFGTATNKNIHKFTKFYYDGGATPTGTVSPSDRLGYTIGTWTEMTAANTSSIYLGPTNAAYDPTLTGISFDPTNAEFYGFLDGHDYYITVNLQARIDGTGSYTGVYTYYLELQTRNQNTTLYSAIDNFTKLPDSVYGGASYTPWVAAGNMSLFTKFENSNPALNTVRINVDTDQDQNYHIQYAAIEIIQF